ncbi:MAG: AsmA family protein [Proteobacteria bacterium]|nr:AsmA family protein [Pseudomonadota bacterium]
MPRSLKWCLASLGALAALAAAVLLFFDWNAFKPYLEKKASRQSGRSIGLDDISVDLSLTPLIIFSGLRIGNIEEGSEGDMLTLERLAFRIELLELLRGRVVLPTVAFDQPKLLLERLDTETANWQFEDNAAGLAVSGPAPEDRTEMPVIGSLTISNGELRYRDRVEDLDVTMIVDTATGAASNSENAVRLAGEGQIKDSPFTLDLTGGSIQHLRDPDRPYPFAAHLKIGETEAWLDGTIDQPFDMRGFDMEMRLRGSNAARLFPVLDLALPETPPFDVEGRLRYDGIVWRFDPFSGTMGDSDLAGSLHYSTETERGRLTGDLHSKVLDFDDLAGFIGATPDTGAGETASAEQTQKAAREDGTERVIPDEPIDIAQLKAMDADVVYSAASVATEDLPIDRLDAKVILENGHLRLAPASFGIQAERIDAFVDLDGTRAVPHIRARFDIRQLPLKEVLTTFVTDLAEDSETFGAIGGQAEIEGTGQSLHEFLASADGRIGLATEGGRIGGILVELAGLDIAEALGLVVTELLPIRWTGLTRI